MYVCVCLYVCMYVYVCVCMYVCMHAYVCVYELKTHQKVTSMSFVMRHVSVRKGRPHTRMTDSLKIRTVYGVQRAQNVFVFALLMTTVSR